MFANNMRPVLGVVALALTALLTACGHFGSAF